MARGNGINGNEIGGAADGCAAKPPMKIGIVRIEYVDIPDELYSDLAEACRIRQEIDEDSDMDARPTLFIHDFEEASDELLEWARGALDFGEDDEYGVEIDL